jgi:hypothetical protein
VSGASRIENLRIALSTAGVFIAAAIFSCYNPKVGPSLVCAAPPAKQCPDGFKCGPDNLCVGIGVSTGGTSGGTGGAGGACANPIISLCSSTTPVTPCDPVCQTGCPCGLQCALTATGVGCVAQGGSQLEGQVCHPAADNCAPGYVCVKDACSNMGRCHRFCLTTDSNVCTASMVCGTPVPLANGTGSSQRACNFGDASCNAVSQTGCPDPALICFATGLSSSLCDCPSGKNLAQGDDCVDYNDCLPGLWCLRLTQDGPTQCLRLCNSTADCPGCTFLGPSRGYCP